MSTVKYVTQNFKQPYGGFLKVKDFDKEQFDDAVKLNNQESLHASIVGMATEYLSEVMLGMNKADIFRTSLRGALNLNLHSSAMNYLENIKGLDDDSIISACRLSGYDVAFRHSLEAYRPVEDFIIDQSTLENIRTMVNRSVIFYEHNGPVIKIGMTFEGAYTDKILKGDGDILTSDGLWDMKVIKNNITNKHTLQLLVYYLMGLRSVHSEKFNQLKKIGIFNPRLNISYVKQINSISSDIIQTVEKEVIGY